MYVENNTTTLNCQIAGHVPSMTTVEIAELTGKRHDHVMRDAKAMLTELYGESSLPNFGESYKAENGQVYPCCRLPKKEILVLVSGYSIKLRMKIVTRLEVLEKRASDPITALNDPAAMRQILLTYTERVISLEKTVQTQAPKVATLDRIATADGSMCITDAAKHLQVRPKELFQYLVEHGWIYRRTGNKSYLAYQNRIQQGVMEHKISTQIAGDGIERIREQARVTPKGLTKLSAEFEAALV